jgi:hypothetical protein
MTNAMRIFPNKHAQEDDDLLGDIVREELAIPDNSRSMDDYLYAHVDQQYISELRESLSRLNLGVQYAKTYSGSNIVRIRKAMINSLPERFSKIGTRLLPIGKTDGFRLMDHEDIVKFVKIDLEKAQWLAM